MAMPSLSQPKQSQIARQQEQLTAQTTLLQGVQTRLDQLAVDRDEEPRLSQQEVELRETLDNLQEKLAAIPEGDGSMLDNTTLIYFSDVGDKHHASNREWPYIVIGDMGGRLKTAGRYILGKPHGFVGLLYVIAERLLADDGFRLGLKRQFNIGQMSHWRCDDIHDIRPHRVKHFAQIAEGS